MRTSALIKALRTVDPGLSHRNIPGIFTHFCLLDDYVYGWSGGYGVTYKLAEPVGLVGGVERELLDAMERIVAKEVKVWADDKNGESVLFYKAKKQRGHYALLPPKEMKYLREETKKKPGIPVDAQEIAPTVSIPLTEEVISALAHCRATASHDTTWSENYGVTMAFGFPAHISCYSTNAISIQSIDVEVPVDPYAWEPFAIIFDPDMLDALIASIKAEGAPAIMHLNTKGLSKALSELAEKRRQLKEETGSDSIDVKEEAPKVRMTIEYGSALFFGVVYGSDPSSYEDLLLHRSLLGGVSKEDYYGIPETFIKEVENVCWSAREIEENVCKLVMTGNQIQLYGRKRVVSGDNTPREHLWGHCHLEDEHEDLTSYFDASAILKGVKEPDLQLMLINEQRFFFRSLDGMKNFIVAAHPASAFETVVSVGKKADDDEDADQLEE